MGFCDSAGGDQGRKSPLAGRRADASNRQMPPRRRPLRRWRKCPRRPGRTKATAELRIPGGKIQKATSQSFFRQLRGQLGHRSGKLGPGRRRGLLLVDGGERGGRFVSKATSCPVRVGGVVQETVEGRDAGGDSLGDALLNTVDAFRRSPRQLAR